MKFALLLIFILLANMPGAWSQSTPTASPQSYQPAADLAAPVSGEAARPTEKSSTMPMIGAGDLLKVSVFGAPESDQEVRVGADGNISLHFIGSVQVAGLTTEQAEAIIATKLRAGSFFTEPQVSVFAKEYATQGVSVLGEVLKPGVYPLLGSRTLFDVLSLAGGTAPRAGRTVSITHRNHPQTPRTVSLSNDAAKSVQSNVDVFPGDIVVVSRADIVYVVGEVRKPSGVIMENGAEMTVLQAIAMAEGTGPDAALNKAKLIRKTQNGPQEIALPLKDMLSAKSPDVSLHAEDIIFVPSSAAKSATKRGLEAIIQAATGVAVYRR